MKLIDIKNKESITEIKESITEIYAAISIDDAGNECISAIGNEDGDILPIVFGYKYMIDIFIPFIANIAKGTNKKIRIVKFTNKEIIEEFNFNQ